MHSNWYSNIDYVCVWHTKLKLTCKLKYIENHWVQPEGMKRFLPLITQIMENLKRKLGNYPGTMHTRV